MVDKHSGAKDARSILKNTSASFAALLLAQATAMVSAAYLARTLGPALTGVYSYSFSIVTIVIRLANFGMDQPLTREVAQNRKAAGRLLVSSLALRMPICLLIYVALLLLLHFDVLKYKEGLPSDGRLLMYVVWLTIFVESATQAIRAVFIGLERQEISSAVMTGVNVLRALLTILIVAMGYRLFHMGMVVLVVGAAGAVVMLKSLSGQTKIDLRTDISAVKSMAVVGSSFVMMDLCLGVVSRFDIVYLPAMVSLKDLGLYTSSHRLLDMLLAAGLAADMALFPIIARRCQEAPESLRRVWDAAHKYLAIAAVPIAFLTSLLAEGIMLLIFGDKFVGSGPVLGLLIWSGVIFFPMIPSYRILISRNQQSLLLPLFIVKAAASIGLNLLLVPRYGIMGAAAATVSMEILHFILCFAFAFRRVELFPIVCWYVRPLCAALPMIALILLLRDRWHVVLVAVPSIAAYAAALVAIKGVTADDVNVFRNALSRRRAAAQPEESIEEVAEDLGVRGNDP